MKIHAYILCYNEEMILPFTLDYYSKYCEKIILLDNESTDRSREIAAKYPKVSVVSWSSNNQINDFAYVQLKSNIYKNSRGIADWVIVCDCDEILYDIPRLKVLLDENIKLPRVEGFHMVSETFPVHDDTCITQKIKTGNRETIMDKQIVFSPDVNITFELGAHKNICSDKVDTIYPAFKLLHYKFLSSEYLINKNKMYMKRVPEQFKAVGIASHYFIPEQNIIDEVKNRLNQAIVVI